MAKCKCGTKARIVSDVVQSMRCKNGCPQDVCTNPICGDPEMLSIFSPLIYDEIGINLCATFALGVTISTDYPTAVSARAQVLNASYTYGTGNVVIETISGRPNCTVVTLTNITVTFEVSLYDNCCRLLGTVIVDAVYLPSTTTAATYDEETNPTSVELEIFTPYGVSYSAVSATVTDTAQTPVLNYIGFTAGSNTLTQGLNMYGMAKVLDLDADDSTVTMGLTLVLQSLYYAGYKVHSKGKIDVPKGCIISPENADCRRFVAGDLLNLEIKPLDLGAPCFEERDKVDLAQMYSCGTCYSKSGTVPGCAVSSSYPQAAPNDAACTGNQGAMPGDASGAGCQGFAGGQQANPQGKFPQQWNSGGFPSECGSTPRTTGCVGTTGIAGTTGVAGATCSNQPVITKDN